MEAADSLCSEEDCNSLTFPPHRPSSERPAYQEHCHSSSKDIQDWQASALLSLLPCLQAAMPYQ